MTSLVSISASMQDYLETILEIEEKEEAVRITDIAKKMNIAKASVNQTVKKLKSMGLVKHQTYGPVELTKSGKDLALKVKERHILIRKFLINVLEVEPQIAEKDACLMEHVVSRQTMEKLTIFLKSNGYIKEKEIAKEIGEITLTPTNTRALSELSIGEKGKIIKIASKGMLKKKLLDMGIINGCEVVVKGFAPMKDPVEITIKGYNLTLRKEEAAIIFVEVF